MVGSNDDSIAKAGPLNNGLTQAYRAKGQRRIVAKSASIASHQPQIGIFDEPEEVRCFIVISLELANLSKC